MSLHKEKAAGGLAPPAAHNASLIIRPGDPPERAYGLVVGIAPPLRVVGWITGGDPRGDEWWRAPNGGPGAWFDSQSALHPLSTFPQEAA